MFLQPQFQQRDLPEFVAAQRRQAAVGVGEQPVDGVGGEQSTLLGGRRVQRVADEFEYSDLIAEHFGTDHQQILVDPDRMLPAVDAAITAMNEPMVSHDCVAFYLLSEEVAKSVKVVQSGQGADEVFAGYSWYPPLARVPRSRAVPEQPEGRAILDDSGAMARPVAGEASAPSPR